MTSITLTLTGAKAQATVSGPLTSGMVGIPVTIEYDEEWNDLTKNLVCSCGKWGPDREETRTVRSVGSTATVAHEVMKGNMYLYLGIEGYSADGKLVMPTIWADCGKIQYGANANADPSTNPKLPFWAQLQTEIRQMKDEAFSKKQIAAGIAAYLKENPIILPDDSLKVSLPADENGSPIHGVVGWYAVSDGKGGIAWVESAPDTDSGNTDTGTHGIVWDLVYVTSSNPVTSVNDGKSLTAVLTPAEGYTLGDVTVTMGGEVLTGVWNADTAIVTIPSVTGDVVISCAGAAQGSGEVVDTTAVIEVAGKGINNAGRVYASEYWGYTKFYPVNDTQFTLRFTNTAGVSAPTSNAIMTVFLNTEDRTTPFTVKDYSNPLSTANVGKEYTTKNIADGATGLRATILLSEIDNYYLYETNTKKVIFAGKNTPYYGMEYAESVATASEELSYDDDIAQNYAVSTASILGEDTAIDPNKEYGISAELATVIDEVCTAWMTEYGGDYRKIPLIITTDQHARTNAGIFNMLGKTLSMHDVSKVMNLGDTVSVEWYDKDTTKPLVSCAQLEKWCESIKGIPFSKRLDVYGNHDTWYGNYADEGNTVGTRYPADLSHLDQYFRNIYARRNNNNGWFVIRDDYFNVKYVVISGFEYSGGAAFRIGTRQMKFIIDEFGKDDGYDIVVVSHVPLYYQVSTNTYPTGMTPADVTDTSIMRVAAIDTDALFTARKNKTSGTVTDSEGVEHSFGFSGCTTDILCGLHGHTHDDAYNYTDGSGLLSETFDWFDENTVHFVLIDRVNRQLNVWKVEGDALTYQNYQVPLDKNNI